MTDTKTCTKCGETKPLDEFAIRRQSADGRSPKCRDCKSQYDAAYRAANKQRISDRNAEYRRLNRERIASYLDANKEQIATRHHLWREANREQVAARMAEWRAANRAHLRQYAIDNAHFGWAARYRRRCAHAGLEPVVEHFTRADVVTRYGDSCTYCETGEFEHLDHFIPIKDGGPHTLDNVRPSCAACNLAKHDKHPGEWLAEQAELDDLTEDELNAAIDAEIDRWTN